MISAGHDRPHESREQAGVVGTLRSHALVGPDATERLCHSTVDKQALRIEQSFAARLIPRSGRFTDLGALQR
jgi:hypothetical protein